MIAPLPPPLPKARMGGTLSTAREQEMRKRKDQADKIKLSHPGGYHVNKVHTARPPLDPRSQPPRTPASVGAFFVRAPPLIARGRAGCVRAPDPPAL
eukprot:CAMPEP_0174924332 /NCGR_PEP_ID=MMETSP1355-20121228/7175_1 /TAXON_ID=464990 /ORGANISM="Hemiselmis tepida, Strain CCMP443" /LENGTH=96 /DNA_ID=CAMNT_0016170119 /DNA_START=160 /DNA_END=450 /DNA_ORIENTATION=-